MSHLSSGNIFFSEISLYNQLYHVFILYFCDISAVLDWNFLFAMPISVLKFPRQHHENRCLLLEIIPKIL